MVALVLGVLVAGVAWAGWQIRRATDTTLVDPIVLPTTVELRSGDIIMAGGVSMQSRLVLSLTDDNKYSHVGLIEKTPQGLFVIHAAPHGEGDGGVGDRVARIPLSLFLSERGYVTAHVVRLDHSADGDTTLADSAIDYAIGCIERAVPFDNKFDLAEHETMYCSELVFLAYRHAGYRWPDTLVSNVSTLVADGPVILPGAFCGCNDFKTVWEHSTKGTQ